MGVFSKIFGKSSSDLNTKKITIVSTNDSFDPIEYDRYNNKKIKEFENRYDLWTVEGINSIPISEAERYPDGGKSVVYMPEQILNRLATRYKNDENYDLAIACLKKANELYSHSFYGYTRNDYERLVDFYVLAGRFNEAREEHKKLDQEIGTWEDELKRLQSYIDDTDNWETKEDYQKRVIDPYLEQSYDRECYYWLLENLPRIAPKSFNSYRRMKNKNSENFNKILEEISKTGNSIDNIKFWD